VESANNTTISLTSFFSFLRYNQKVPNQTSTNKKIELSEDQQLALDQILAWYKDEKRVPYITLGGYAGTGKTTLISIFRKRLNEEKKGLKVAFVSYTGKATRVLQTKIDDNNSSFLKDTVSTIHSLIYSPQVNDEEEITGWKLKEELEADLIIIDEASMVDQKIWNDLLSYEVPIIAVGDHGQLPPINGNFNLMANPRIKIEKIHRQAEGNPIIHIATIARENGAVPIGKHSDTVMKFARSDYESSEIMMDHLRAYNPNTLILCGYNNTRIKLNNFIRNALEIFEQHPQQGDRVICLRNNHVKQIANGMLGTIEKIEDPGEKHNYYKAEIKMDGVKELYKGNIFKAQFNNPQSLNFTDQRRLLGDTDLFDYGYALTVHKAQGSQAKKVILFEERFKNTDDEMWKRWLYTGITRAEEELYMLG
jgi:exodeoxyribonuclease-5